MSSPSLKHAWLTAGILLICLFIGYPGSLKASETPPKDRKLIISKEDGKYGLVSRKGKTVLSPRYDSLSYTEQPGLYVAYLMDKSGKIQAGLINTKGKEIITISYHKIDQVAQNRYAVQESKEGVALFNEEGEKLTGFVFDRITAFKGELARFYQDGKAGVLDREGNIRLQAAFQDVLIRSNTSVDVIELRRWEVRDSKSRLSTSIDLEQIQPVDKNLWMVSTRFYDSAGRAREAVSFADTTGKLLFPFRQLKVISLHEQLIKYRNGRFSGVITLDGSPVLPAAYDSVTVLPTLILAGRRENSRWNWQPYSLAGQPLTKTVYQSILPTEDALLPALRDGKWGYIDQRGKELLMCRYDSTLFFEGDFARVRYNNKEGIIGRDGRWIISPSSEHIQILAEGNFLLRQQDRQLLKDAQGNTLFETKGHLQRLSNGRLLEVSPDQLQGILSAEGKQLVPTQYDWIRLMPEAGLYLAQLEGTYGMLHENGRFIPEGPTTFDRILGYSEGFFPILLQGKYGFTDQNGKLRISNRYDSVTHFSEGLAAVSLLGRWGYVNKYEQLQLQPVYDAAGPFIEGLAKVNKNGKFGLITKKGEETLPAWYDAIERLSSGRFLIRKNGRMGLADKDGHLMLQPKYDSLKYLNNGYLLVERNNKRGLMTLEGISTIAMMCEAMIYDQYNQLFLCSRQKPNIRRIELEPAE